MTYRPRAPVRPPPPPRPDEVREARRLRCALAPECAARAAATGTPHVVLVWIEPDGVHGQVERADVAAALIRRRRGHARGSAAVAALILRAPPPGSQWAALATADYLSVANDPVPDPATVARAAADLARSTKPTGVTSGGDT